MPDTITTPEGVAFRPNLLATTSFDGSIATTYKRTVTDTVCDNTRELALSERGQQVKVKHSRNSRAQLGPARQALQMVHTLADDFAQEVARLCQVEVAPSGSFRAISILTGVCAGQRGCDGRWGVVPNWLVRSGRG